MNVITQFISGLSENGKKLLAVALIILIVALFDRLLVAPTLSRMAAIDQDIVKEESSIKQDLHFLNYKDKIVKESKSFEPYMTQKLPAEEEIIAAFLKKLDVLASKANVTIAKVTPSTGVQEKDFIKYHADLECSGKLADVITFMHLADASTSELMKVTKFNLSSKKSDTDDLKAVMTIEKVVVGKRPAAPAAAAAAPSSNAAGQ